MLTIKDIKDFCIEVDLSNLDSDIGVFEDGKYLKLTNEKEIRIFYSRIDLTTLLEIYASYNGLECYKKDNPEDYQQAYSLDFLDVLKYLKSR